MTINPNNLTNYEWNDYELEEFWIFSICVAGKNADTTAKAVGQLLKPARERDIEPLTYIANLILDNCLYLHLKYCGIGQYTRITKALGDSLTLNLRTASIDDLEKIKGVGMKTSRFFLLHTRRNIEVAILDTHILKFLKSLGYDNVPKSTPPKSSYRKWEEIYLEEAKKFDMPLADLDLMLWKIYSKRI